MAKIFVRDIDNTWIDICKAKLRVLDQNLIWRQYLENNFIALGENTWQKIECPIDYATDITIPCGQLFNFSFGGKHYPRPYILEVPLGNNTGTVTVECQAITIADKFEIWWNERLVATSGYIGNLNQEALIYNTTKESILSVGYKVLKFNKNLATPYSMFIKVYSLDNNTLWRIFPHCINNTVNTSKINVFNNSDVTFVVIFRDANGDDGGIYVNNITELPPMRGILNNDSRIGNESFSIYPSHFSSGSFKVEILRNNIVINTYTSSMSNVASFNVNVTAGPAYEIKISKI